MKKKIVMSLLSAMMVGSLVFSNNAMTVKAAEADEPMVADEIGDILDGIFGGDKPEYKPDGDYGNDFNGGQELDPDADINWGPTDSGNDNNSQPTPPAPPAPPTKPVQPVQPGVGGNGGTTIPGGNGGTTLPGGTIPGGNGGTTLPGGTIPGGNGGTTLPGGTITGGGVVLPGGSTGNGGNVVLPDGSTGNTTVTPVGGCVTIPVIDENLLKIFPESMYVFTPEGKVSFNSLDATKKTYNVWVDGQLANQLAIVDAKNNLVELSAPQIVNDATGKTYLNITIPATTKGAKVLATEAQKAAFTRLYGIDGVMVNGVLVEAFQDTIRN